MILLVQLGSWLALLAATGSLAVAWSDPRPALTADDAATVAVGALDGLGYTGPVVGEPRRGIHVPENTDREVAVWRVVLDVEGDEIELDVQRTVGQVVWIDDRIGADLRGRLLTDEAFTELGAYRDDIALRRQVDRNLWITGAAVAAAAVALALLTHGVRTLRRRVTGPGTGAVP